MRQPGERKKKARVARELQAAEVRKSCRTRMTMDVAREFEHIPFWIPWSFDYQKSILLYQTY